MSAMQERGIARESLPSTDSDVLSDDQRQPQTRLSMPGDSNGRHRARKRRRDGAGLTGISLSRVWHGAASLLYRIGVVASVALLLAVAIWVMGLANVSQRAATSVSAAQPYAQGVLNPVDAAAGGASVAGISTPAQTTGAGGQSGGGSAMRTAPARTYQYGNQPFKASGAWLQTTAASTGIPIRALAAYASAQLRLAAQQPSCGLGWNTIAAIGAVESGHGTHGGSQLLPDGTTSKSIFGPALSGGNGNAAIQGTNAGSGNGAGTWDRAQGPMQFISSTWARWGSDNSGDGKADVNQIDDAAWSAARYLCNTGSLNSADQWRSAIYSYNHSDQYVNQIADIANRYAAAAK